MGSQGTIEYERMELPFGVQKNGGLALRIA
jgi:hypothetical protein